MSAKVQGLIWELCCHKMVRWQWKSFHSLLHLVLGALNFCKWHKNVKIPDLCWVQQQIQKCRGKILNVVLAGVGSAKSSWDITPGPPGCQWVALRNSGCHRCQVYLIDFDQLLWRGSVVIIQVSWYILWGPNLWKVWRVSRKKKAQIRIFYTTLE